MMSDVAVRKTKPGDRRARRAIPRLIRAAMAGGGGEQLTCQVGLLIGVCRA